MEEQPLAVASITHVAADTSRFTARTSPDNGEQRDVQAGSPTHYVSH